MGEKAPKEEGTPVSSESVCKPDISPSSSSTSSSYEIGTADNDEDGRKRSFGARSSFLTVPVVSSPGFAAGGGSGLLATSTPVVTSPIVAVPVMAVPYFISPSGLDGSMSFKEQLSMTHQAVLATVTAQARIQLQAGCADFLEASSRPTSFPPGPSPLRRVRSIKSEEISISSKAQQYSALDKKPHSTHLIVKATSSDGYNWRKYGQKQVKSSENFRSYFRCTHANCFAKKNVEHCQDGRVIEVIYRGQHNHEPPPKVKCFKEKNYQSDNPEGEKTSLHFSRLEVNSLDLCSPKTENDPYNDTPERPHCSSDSEGDPAVNIGDDTANQPDLKRRLCEVSVSYSAPSFKTFKEPKVVVHAVCNSGTVNDGYRWRKYGQKMVKGNPNPRSYYRCTNMGCPVRKHVEKASDDAKVVIITYEGQHNHDLPPSKSGSETPTCTPAAKLTVDDKEAAATSDEHMQVSSPLLLLDKKVFTDCKLKKVEEISEEGAQDLGGKLVLESAETLLSIRCNSAPGDGGKASTSNVIQCPLFERSHSVVSVRNS